MSSTVFPPDGGPVPGPLIRTPGTFTFSVPASSRVVGFDYVPNGTMSTPPGMNPHVAVIAGTGWSGLTVIGVVDVTGDNIPDLVARDDTTGDIWLYQGATGGTFGGQTTRVLLGIGLKAETFPLVIAKGDADGDGHPDIWAVRKNGDLFLLPGRAGGGFGGPRKVANHHAWAGLVALG